ncbi:PREDICTED: uncharacterized protein LOC104820589 [Tarenaya hassleriana]|uniref:uncharacterized protein LOC104820589 n=1 Tax=Tarenaya hassleriana TaxID=28532 RepID=UPI00053C48D0|nr:PREDICTED: uncharacterized protein LOC104820589 [Tarenaya hassleriana]XP_010549395.1 PREDICTED: uncharacterized protein LOC104820589 [Tarenaya hassleriana]XP_010549396.1 PREDICTED: uncharacterized protein LOC104820589 [Tarenaya hassleriana]
MTSETSKKKGPLQIFKLDTASKLAEQWIKDMSKPAEDEQTVTEQARPHRLGLGAKVSKQTKRRPSDNPLDQKLQGKLDAGRRKHAKTVAESMPFSNKNTGHDSDDDDDESESKSRAFGKKKAVPQASPLQAKKKK